ncbi:MAG: outer membrane lipoprotein-sorting protein [Alphaproteobacteria bacterium]|nr:outer membrane lipoprotein-sorting protein [Alphaproteobacteria bacterium]
MVKQRVLCVSALLIAASVLSADASQQLPGDPKAKGRDITAESIRRDAGFGDTRSEMTMSLMSDGAEVSRRTLRMSVLEEANEQLGDKSVIFFETPKDVQGTVLLTHTKILTPDDQWIYIPAISRVKRIASANKSGPFLGSEFAYEDLTAQELGKYDYVWLRDEACPAPDAARKCSVIQRRPLYENSGYKRQVSWIDNTDYQFRKIEFYNQEDRLLKTLTLSGYQLHEGRYWRPHQLLMVNHQTGRSTKLDVTELKLRTGLTQTDFTEQAMERLR